MNWYNWFCVWTTICTAKLSKAATPRTSKYIEPIVFPDEEMKPRTSQLLEGIPLELAHQLSNAKNLDEFLDNYVEPKSIPYTEHLVSARFGGEPRERKAVRTAKMATCTPEQTTISLKPPDTDLSTFYYPPCTRVARCGGCCSHELLSCQPTEVEILQLGVVVTEYRGGSQLSYKGRDVISVEQHKSCKCDCKVKEADCNPYQAYSKESCSCICTNTDKQEKCNNESATKIWNNSDCSCVCRDILECSSGRYFDKFTCECLPERRRQNASDFDWLSYHKYD